MTGEVTFAPFFVDTRGSCVTGLLAGGMESDSGLCAVGTPASVRLLEGGSGLGLGLEAAAVTLLRLVELPSLCCTVHSI